jgi:hypothetical protein
LPTGSSVSRRNAPPISSIGRIACVRVAARAADGMPGTTASEGSWTITRPPASATATAPAAPSSSEPDNTIAMPRSPQARASERNIGSAAGRTPFSFGPRLSSTTSARISRWKSAGAT